ncbi:hypothetical protein LTR08_006160 [Meristemomyces frigidus]|nr:hypothetical protein LTR08_006160 [Meristemomyces frigidus]
MMPSSPPTRAWDRALPAGSEYSLDLGALDLDGHSNASSPLPKQRVDRVLSDDIEGPSDFTLNLEKWMNGGTLGKSTTRGARKPLQSLEARQVNARDGRASRQHLDAPPLSPHKTVSNHTPSDTPPKESVWNSEPNHVQHDHHAEHIHRGEHDRHEARSHYEEDDDTEEHVSSDWDPYEEGSTPQPPAHQQFLQPTVEDYHSELTPAHISRAKVDELPQQPYPQLQQSPKQQHSQTEVHLSPSRMSNSSTPGRPSSPTLSPIRSPVMKRAAPARLDSPFIESRPSRAPPSRAEADARLQNLEARCQQLMHLNGALKQALDEEQRIRRAEKLAHDAHIANTARRERDLTEMKDQAYKRVSDFRGEFMEQKERLRVLEAQMVGQRLEGERLGQHHREEVGMLRDELEGSRAVHEREVLGIEQELELERWGRDDAEEATRVLREEAEERKGETEKEVQNLKVELQRAEGVRANIAESEGHLKNARQEAVELRTAKSMAEEETSRLSAEVAELRAAREGETGRHTADHQRAVALGETLQNKLRELQQQLRDEQAARDKEIERLQAAHDKEIERLQDSHDDDGGIAATEECEALRTELDSLRNDFEANHSLLNSAILERDEAVDSLESLQASQSALQISHQDLTTSHTTLQTEHHVLQTEHTVLQTQLAESQTRVADSEIVNTALDTQVAELVGKREGYWKGRLEASEMERKTMAKALLHSWGRDEVGRGSPQGYGYKFVSRGSPGKEETVG